MGVMQGINLERSRKDVKHFYEWLNYVWGDHIGDWMDLFADRKDASVHRVCIIAPRDHSKSTTLRVKILHHCLFERWRDKPFTVWLFSASKDLAARRLEEMKDDLAQPTKPPLPKMRVRRLLLYLHKTQGLIGLLPLSL